MNIILYYFLPFILLYICFPWYASVHAAIKAKRLSLWDIGIQAIPFLLMGALDIYCNIWASFLFWEFPFLRRNWTLSQRCCYWYHRPDKVWQYGLAHAVKVQTDKYEKDHII
jgi:hypothetical protein